MSPPQCVTDVGRLGITQTSAITGFRSAVDVERPLRSHSENVYECWEGSIPRNCETKCSTSWEENPLTLGSTIMADSGLPLFTANNSLVTDGSSTSRLTGWILWSALVSCPHIQYGDVISLHQGVTLPMELDMGAPVSLISERMWKEILPGSELVKCATLLKTCTGERLHVLGQLQVRVDYSDQEKCLPLLVVAGNGPSLWGRNWLNEIRLDWGCINWLLDTMTNCIWKLSRKFWTDYMNMDCT